MILIVIAGQAQKSMPVGELNLLGLSVPGVPRNGAARGDYEANGAVQLAQDNFDCGLEDRPPTGGGVAMLFVKELLGRYTSRNGWS